MTCDDYLAMLETLPIDDLTHGAAREHSAICRDCNRVTRVVADRERNMIIAYGDIMPSAAAVTVAELAIATSHRRRTARFYTLGLAIAAVATVATIIGTRVARQPGLARGFVEQEFALRCMSARRAAGVVLANIPDRLHTIVRAHEPEGVLVVAGTPQTLQVARSVLDQYDTQCIVKDPAPPR